MADKHRRSAPETAEEGPERKRAKSLSPRRVALNPADCNLDFNVGSGGLEGHALHEGGFAYCWSGARATVGIRGGKYCFGCKVISDQKVDMEDTPPDQQHVCRIGISRGDDPVGNLGESNHSFGFGGTGKFSNAGKFSDYGVKFGVGDVIVCAVNFEDETHASVGFSKNGQWLGVALKFDASPKGHGVGPTSAKLAWSSAFFPHVLLKNVDIQMQFSMEDGLLPVDGFKPWNRAIEDGKAVDGPVFSEAKDCEVMMMVGLPASGKTTWCERWAKEHPEKRYILLGTNLALDQMKVPGLLRKQNYGERFERLMDRATGIFNTLLSRASKTPRNYILDQTNVYKSARKRKLRQFADYRKVAVVIFPNPDELKHRAEKRFKEMGKEVPPEAVNEMLANYVLPTSKGGSDESFDEVIFTELGRAEAQKVLEEMKRDLPNAKITGSSPYSRQSSVQSFSSPMGSHRSFAGSSGPSQDYRTPPEVPCKSSSHGTPGSMPYCPRPSMSGYDRHPDYGSSSTFRDGHSPYNLCSRTPPGSGPYRGTDVNDVQRILNYDESSLAGRNAHQASRYPPDRYGSPLGIPTSYGGSSMYGGSQFHHGNLPARELSYGGSRFPPADLAPSQQSALRSYGSHGAPPADAYDNPRQTGQWYPPSYPSPGYHSSGHRY